MKEKMLEDDLEAPSVIGNGEIWIACLCIGMSLLCGLVWVGLLIAPQMLHAVKH